MLKERARICDVCGEDIPKGTKYRKSTMSADVATFLAVSDDPELVPTWTVNADGAVTMDICLTCTVSMDAGTPKGQSH